jgi:hypothetical protein
MLLTRGMFPQILAARIWSREVFHGFFSRVGVCPIAATLTTRGKSILAANGKGVAIDCAALAQPRRPVFGLDRLKIGIQGPIGLEMPRGSLLSWRFLYEI